MIHCRRFTFVEAVPLSFAATLTATARTIPLPPLAHLQRELDPAWITTALIATGIASLRRRRLPAE
jgi:hypothetical protein